MNILKIWNVIFDVYVLGLKFLVQICQELGKPYEEYNQEFLKLKRQREAEEARFTDFNQGDGYFNEDQGGYDQGYTPAPAPQRHSQYEAPTNRGGYQVRPQTNGYGDDEEDEGWGDDADELLPE